MSGYSRKNGSGPETSTTQSSTQTTQSSGKDNSVVQEEMKENSAYTGAFGDKVGGWLFDQVDKATSPDKIDGYALKGLDSASGWLGDQAIDAASSEDKKAATMFKNALKGGVNSEYGGAIKDSQLGETVSGWAKNSPWTMAGLGAAGVAGFILSDQELDDIDTDIKLGDNTSLMVGGDFGSTLDLGVDALRAGAKYKNGNQEFSITGENRFDKPEWSVGADYKSKGSWGNLGANAKLLKQGDRTLATGGINYNNPDLAASLKGSYDSNDGGVGSVSGNIRSLGEGPKWTGGFDANTNGKWNASAGVSSKSDNLEWFAKAYGGQDASGKTDYGARAGLSYRF